MSLKVAYFGVETDKMQEWQDFLDLFGVGIGPRDGGFVGRIDSKNQRFFFVEGPREDLLCCGWEAQTEEEYLARIEKLEAGGVVVTPGTEDELRMRGVNRMVKFKDPYGTPFELCVGHHDVPGNFQSPLMPSGFVAAEGGLGHIGVMKKDDYIQGQAFAETYLDARVSDYIIQEDFMGGAFKMVFLHSNSRHHSVAYGRADVPVEKCIHHIMFECVSLEDMGRAYERVVKAGTPMATVIGQHPNDKQVSFYAVSPSGFGVELGSGSIEVDDSVWKIKEYDNVSSWGHAPL